MDQHQFTILIAVIAAVIIVAVISFLPPAVRTVARRFNTTTKGGSAVQTAFVDEPRRAVEQADGLVASAMKRLAEVFAEERSKLEQQWDRGDNVSTEDLRIALQRYRSFFHRLLAI
jgi:hypothetical protein